MKDLEEKYAHTLSQLDTLQAIMSMKIVEAASTKFSDPPFSLYNGRPYPWKLKEW
jgi:hypothetical protein